MFPAVPLSYATKPSVSNRIVTTTADQGLVDIHDRGPLVLVPEAAREWMRQDIGGKEAGEIAADGIVSAKHFIWHTVSRTVSNMKDQS
ncbi:SOS response-associated peptidase family protein [Raoultella terrigena]